MFWQSGLSRRYKQAVLNTVNTLSGHSANSLSNSGNNFRVPDLLPNDSASRHIFINKQSTVLQNKTPNLMSTATNTEINKSEFLNNNITKE